MAVCPCLRSQRDRTGEKELREKQLLEYQQRLDKLENEITVAENDRKQFDSAVKRGQEKLTELRQVNTNSACYHAPSSGLA